MKKGILFLLLLSALVVGYLVGSGKISSGLADLLCVFIGCFFSVLLKNLD